MSALITKIFILLRHKGIKIPTEDFFRRSSKTIEETNKKLTDFYLQKVKTSALGLFLPLIIGLAIYIKSGGAEKKSIIPLCALMGVILSILIFILLDYDLEKEHKKQLEQWHSEFVGLLHRILIYLQAGFSTQAVILKIASDYEDKLKKGCKPNPVYDSFVDMKRRLLAGESVLVVLASLGRNAGAEEYMRLGRLLSQNLKRGNSYLMIRLKEELAQAERRKTNKARKLSEEAETKLLLPMVLLLGIVLIMIMIPAFSQMEGG